jgi:CRP-like cAMP-binding protein
MRNSLLILGEFSDKDMDWLHQVGQRIDLPAGAILIYEGQSIKFLYILLEGYLTVTVKVPDIADKQRTVARLTTGEVIGEMSFIDHRPPSATVTAETPAVLLAIPQDHIVQRTREDAEFGQRFYKGLAYCLSNRLRLMNVSLPQAGIEVSGTLPNEIDNPDIMSKLPIARERLDALITAF